MKIAGNNKPMSAVEAVITNFPVAIRLQYASKNSSRGFSTYSFKYFNSCNRSSITKEIVFLPFNGANQPDLFSSGCGVKCKGVVSRDTSGKIRNV